MLKPHRFFALAGTTCALLATAATHAQSTQDGFICDTDKHHIVIDRAANGTLNYRAWNKPRSVDRKPDVEVHGGTEETVGTDPCVNTDWTFRRGNVEYFVSDNARCSEGKPPRNASGMVVVSINKAFASRYWCLR